MIDRLLLIGGGGHCKSVVDSIDATSNYFDVGIVDNNLILGDYILGVPIIGCDEDIPELFKKGYKKAFISIGSVGNPLNRIKLYKKLKQMNFEFPTIIDNSAVVSQNSIIEEGIFVGKKAVVIAGAKIGKNSIINSGAIIEHDVEIGEFVHIAPGAVICGNVKIGDFTHIGANSVVIQGVEVGSNSIIGAGSVVVNHIKKNAQAVGNPCKVVKIL